VEREFEEYDIVTKLNKYMQYPRAHLEREREEKLVSSGSRANDFLVFGRGGRYLVQVLALEPLVKEMSKQNKKSSGLLVFVPLHTLYILYIYFG
jgi:hypothetical protein